MRAKDNDVKTCSVKTMKELELLLDLLKGGEWQLLEFVGYGAMKFMAVIKRR